MIVLLSIIVFVSSLEKVLIGNNQSSSLSDRPDQESTMMCYSQEDAGIKLNDNGVYQLMEIGYRCSYSQGDQTCKVILYNSNGEGYPVGRQNRLQDGSYVYLSQSFTCDDGEHEISVSDHSIVFSTTAGSKFFLCITCKGNITFFKDETTEVYSFEYGGIDYDNPPREITDSKNAVKRDSPHVYAIVERLKTYYYYYLIEDFYFIIIICASCLVLVGLTISIAAIIIITCVCIRKKKKNKVIPEEITSEEEEKEKKEKDNNAQEEREEDKQMEDIEDKNIENKTFIDNENKLEENKENNETESESTETNNQEDESSRNEIKEEDVEIKKETTSSSSSSSSSEEEKKPKEKKIKKKRKKKIKKKRLLIKELVPVKKKKKKGEKKEETIDEIEIPKEIKTCLKNIHGLEFIYEIVQSSKPSSLKIVTSLLKVTLKVIDISIEDSFFEINEKEEALKWKKLRGKIQPLQYRISNRIETFDPRKSMSQEYYEMIKKLFESNEKYNFKSLNELNKPTSKLYSFLKVSMFIYEQNQKKEKEITNE